MSVYQRNAIQHGDALKLLGSMPAACTPLIFFDPQFRDVLDKQKYGNEGKRQRARAALPAMTSDYIDACCCESMRVLRPSGYLMRWIDVFGLCTGQHLRIVDETCECVDLAAWDKLCQGQGYRSRRRGDYLLIFQKPPKRAKDTWRDHGIPDRWPEKVDRKVHPHLKPVGLITRLIAATTLSGDLVIDPAAGSFTVMYSAHRLGREFIGCDKAINGSCGEAETREAG
jgi:site-specific DNA-methyltransferase (adenine-specific)